MAGVDEELDRASQINRNLSDLSSRINGRTSGRRGCSNPAARFSPLQFSDQQLRSLHEKVLRQEPAYARPETRFSSADSLLPAQLYPQPTFPIHEKRLLNYLPGFACDAPSLEYIQVNSVTGAASIVAEGALKPEITMNTTNVLIHMAKIAAHVGISWEQVQDWSAFVDSVTVELTRQVVDTENWYLLQGGLSTAPSAITGFLGTEGILTHDLADDPTGTTPLDAFEMAIADLRVGPALAEPDLVVVAPQTWSAVRRTKDTMDRYLVTPDPAADEPETIWGVRVLTTTQCPAGTAILIDTSKFGRVAVREPIGLRIGYAGTDFTQNILRYVAEERLNMAVERPSAILSLTGLPTS